MKKLVSKVFTIAFGLCVGGVIFAFGQDVDSEKWVKVDDGDGLLSFSVPSDFLVDKDFVRSSLDYRIMAFGHGVFIEVLADRFPEADKLFERLKPATVEAVAEYEFESSSKSTKAAKVKKFSSSEARYQRIFLIAGDRYYKISVGSIVPGRTALNRFVESIKVNGKPIEEAVVSTPAPLETILAKNLKTSQEVKVARSRKEPKRTDTYSYFPIDEFKLLPAKTDPELRNAVIVDENLPVLLAFAKGDHKVKVVLELLASGQIGKVVVYSNLREKTLPLIINAALGVKFIPAKKGSSYVDTVRVIDYSMNVGQPVIHRNMPIPR